MKITPVHSCLAAEVEHVDLARPLDADAFRQVFDALQEYSVLVFHDQRLTDAQQMAFTERFGPLEETLKAVGKENRLHPNLVDLSEHRSRPRRCASWAGTTAAWSTEYGNQLWHTDSSFKPVPAMASLLSGREVPTTGGETEFVSMRHTWSTLPEETRRGLEGRVVVHSILYSRSTIAGACSTPSTSASWRPCARASCAPTR